MIKVRFAASQFFLRLKPQSFKNVKPKKKNDGNINFHTTKCSQFKLGFNTLHLKYEHHEIPCDMETKTQHEKIMHLTFWNINKLIFSYTEKHITVHMYTSNQSQYLQATLTQSKYNQRDMQFSNKFLFKTKTKKTGELNELYQRT